MIYKKLLFILLVNILVSKSVYSEVVRVEGNVSTSSTSKQVALQAKELCKNIGYDFKSEKFNDCVLKVTTANLKKMNKTKTKIQGQEYTFTNTSGQNKNKNKEKKYIFTGAAAFPDAKVNKKHNKLIARYERFPDDRLCISYINKHGVFTKKKQAARLQVIQNRKLDCSQYRDAAYYDKQRRKENIANSTKKLLNDLGEGQQRKADGISRNSRAVLNSMGNKRTCESTRSGNSVSTTCR